MHNDLKERLKDIKNAAVELDRPMRDRVTFRAGGKTDILVIPATEEALIQTVAALEEDKTPYIAIGACSNLLIRDGGYRGALIDLTRLNSIYAEGDRIAAGCGARLTAVTSFALSGSLRGLEFAGGIPGTVGGGVFMNAGAYGGEIKDVVSSARVLRGGEVIRLDNAALGFSYRSSAVMRDGGIVLDAVFSLTPGDEAEGRALVKEYNERRRAKQPVDMPSAGSTFKRVEGYFAAALIEQAGLKGVCVGGAQVSEKHSGFIVNRGGATAADIEQLMGLVQKRVFDMSGVTLPPEVRIIGEAADAV